MYTNTVGIITGRVRSTREGTVFTGVCLLTFRGGYPIQLVGGTPSIWWGVPHPAGKVPHPKSRWGVPHPAGGGGGGEYPIPGPGWGYPGYLPWLGLDGGTQGTPWPGLDGGGTPLARSGWWEGYPGVTPQLGLKGVLPIMTGWMGYPSTMTGWGTPPHPDWMG